MADEYATLADLKKSLNIATVDTTADALLNRALSSASRSIDRTCGRRFWLDSAAGQRTFSPRSRLVCEDLGEVLLVDDIGDSAAPFIEIGSGSTWTVVTGTESVPDNAILDGRPITGLRRPGGTWGLSSSATTRVRIITKWGWPAVPDEVVQATLIQASRLYKRKDSPEGIMGSAEWGVLRLSRRDPDVYGLIENLIRPGFG